MAFAPSGKQAFVVLVRHIAVGGVNAAIFQIWLGFQPLREVVPPVQPARERLQAALPSVEIGVTLCCQFGDAVPRFVPNAARAERPPTRGGHSSANPPCRQRIRKNAIAFDGIIRHRQYPHRAPVEYVEDNLSFIIRRRAGKQTAIDFVCRECFRH